MSWFLATMWLLNSVPPATRPLQVPFRFDASQRAILVELEINQRPVLLIMDTGATNTLIRREAAGMPPAHLKKSAFDSTAPGLSFDGVWTGVSVRAGERIWPHRKVIAIDCDFSTIYVDKPDGILGQDFFTEFRTVLIDFSAHRLVLE